MQKKLITIAMPLLCGIAITSFAAQKATTDTSPQSVGRQASASIKGLGASKVIGLVTFTENPKGGVEVTGELHGLKPSSQHGFHVHEKGDCSGDGSAAGAHFNPMGHSHGGVESLESHVGDLGNVTSDANGDAKISVFKKSATLDQGSTAVVGKSVIIHEKADDMKSQPSGDAGSRIGCGVIQLNKISVP